MCPACAATPAGGGPEGAAASALMGEAAAATADRPRPNGSPAPRCPGGEDAAAATTGGAAGVAAGDCTTFPLRFNRDGGTLAGEALVPAAPGAAGAVAAGAAGALTEEVVGAAAGDGGALVGRPASRHQRPA
jgi:hypothetical protein